MKRRLKKIILRIFDWIKKNKEWLFSGIGITALTIVLGILKIHTTNDQIYNPSPEQLVSVFPLQENTAGYKKPEFARAAGYYNDGFFYQAYDEIAPLMDNLDEITPTTDLIMEYELYVNICSTLGKFDDLRPYLMVLDDYYNSLGEMGEKQKVVLQIRKGQTYSALDLEIDAINAYDDAYKLLNKIPDNDPLHRYYTSLLNNSMGDLYKSNPYQNIIYYANAILPYLYGTDKSYDGELPLVLPDEEWNIIPEDARVTDILLYSQDESDSNSALLICCFISNNLTEIDLRNPDMSKEEIEQIMIAANYQSIFAKAPLRKEMETHEKILVATAYSNLANSVKKMGDSTYAEKYINRSIDIFETSSLPHDYYARLADAYRERAFLLMTGGALIVDELDFKKEFPLGIGLTLRKKDMAEVSIDFSERDGGYDLLMMFPALSSELVSIESPSDETMSEVIQLYEKSLLLMHQLSAQDVAEYEKIFNSLAIALQIKQEDLDISLKVLAKVAQSYLKRYPDNLPEGYIAIIKQHYERLYPSGRFDDWLENQFVDDK